MRISFCRTNQKTALQKEIKDWTFKAYLFTEELSLWFPANWMIENDLCMFIEFFVKWRGLDCFLQLIVLPWVRKITVTCPKCRVKFDFPKVSKFISFELLKVNKMTSQKMSKRQIWISGKPHSLGSIGYSTPGGTKVITY